MHPITVSAYIAKLKTSLWLVAAAHFLHDFSIKMFLIWYSYNGQSFNVTHIFLSQDIKQNLLGSYLDSWWGHELQDFLGSTSKAMADREKKRERRKYKNLNFARAKRAF